MRKLIVALAPLALLPLGCASPALPDLDQATASDTIHAPIRYKPAGATVNLQKVLSKTHRTLLFFEAGF